MTTGFKNWWTVPKGVFHAVGDKVKFVFPPKESYWTFEATKLIPNTYVEMLCVDAYHIHEGQPEGIIKEWLNTKVEWTITETSDGSEIAMIHHGLKPELLCFEICEAGWDFFFQNSLKAFLNSGQGKAHDAATTR